MLFDYFNDIIFSEPQAFVLFILVLFMVGWYIFKNKNNRSSLPVSTITASGLGSWRSSLSHLPFMCRVFCLSFIIIALARPQTMNDDQHAEGEGIDIVLCIDVSGSMSAQDFQPNRLEVAKKVAIDFVNKRLTDRIGIVIFSGESFTICPLTTDHNVLVSALKGIRNGLLEDGTAIGSGLATSVDRLRSGTTKTKVVLLLTDGENNGGLIDPKTAKEIAKNFGIRVYTVGMASEGYAPQPVNTELGVVMQNQKITIDEKLLQEIASETGGKYFRARDNESLAGIYRNIDVLEKSKMEIVNTIRYQEKFFPFVLAAICFLLLEVIFNYTLFRKFP